jgi:hypothetical protein
MHSRLLIAVVLLAAVGCKGEISAPVSGRVTLDGKPLANARVNFQPDEDGKVNPGPGSFAETDKDGRYSLELMDGGMGAMIGKHRVMITKITSGTDPADDRTRQRNQVPRRYNLDTELTCTVPPGGRTDADFELHSK